MANYLLTNSNIDIISDEIGAFLDKCKVDRKDAMRIKLAAEETLLNYQERFGEEKEVSLDCRKRLGRPRIEFSIIGERYNLFEAVNTDKSEMEGSAVLHGILTNMGIAPNWEYKNGVNLIVFTPKRKPPSQVAQLGISIVASVICGFLCMLLPDSLRLGISEELITPVFGSFMGLLSAISGPLIFLSVAWGIYSIGDTATLGTIGKRMISRILKMSFLLTILGVAPMLFFFNLSLEGATSFKFSALLKIILDMIPNNFFAPFVNGNPLQIIFIAAIVGLAMLILGSKTTVAATMIEQSNYIVQLIMETISKFVPVFIFGSVFNMIISGNFSALMKAYKVLPLMLLGQITVIGFYLLWVSLRKKVSPQLLMKKTFQSFLIALTTASSSAVFSSNIETCERQLGVDKRIVNFGVPLGQIIFMLGCSTMFMASALGMAEIYGVNISPLWLLTGLIISVILAIVAPPIPGGALTCYTMLFVQLNIPAEAIPIIIALNVIMEFFATPCNIFTLQMELVELAGDLNMLNYDKLRKPMK